MKIIRRILIGIAALIALFIVGLVGVVTVDAAVGPTAADFTNTTYTTFDGTSVDAYLATPPGEGPFPAVIMIHEFWGMNAEITQMADILAREGYVVLAPDTYRGKQTALVPRAIYLVLTVDGDRVDRDVDAAYEWLFDQPNVDAGNVGIIGFCYGGGVTLRHATRNPNLAAAVDLYGDPIGDPAALGVLPEAETPVFSVFGAIDNMIPLSEVDAYEAAMAQAGVPHTVMVYPGVGHAFVQPNVLDAPGSPRDAWADILAFFEEHLQN